MEPFREKINSNGAGVKSGGAGGVAFGARLKSGGVLLSADGVKAEPDGAGLWPDGVLRIHCESFKPGHCPRAANNLCALRAASFS